MHGQQNIRNEKKLIQFWQLFKHLNTNTRCVSNTVERKSDLHRGRCTKSHKTRTYLSRSIPLLSYYICCPRLLCSSVQYLCKINNFFEKLNFFFTMTELHNCLPEFSTATDCGQLVHVATTSLRTMGPTVIARSQDTQTMRLALLVCEYAAIRRNTERKNSETL